MRAGLREGKWGGGGVWWGEMGGKLICLCILTVFIHAAAAALMRNTFGLILLPYAAETAGGRRGAAGRQTLVIRRAARTNTYAGLFPSRLIVLNHRNC